MKRNDLKAGMHVLVASGDGWDRNAYRCERHLVIDTGAWVQPSRGYGVAPKEHVGPGGKITLTHARPAMSTLDSKNAVLLLQLDRDGEPKSGLAYAIPLGQIRGEWDTTFAEVLRKEDAARSASIAAREALDARREAGLAVIERLNEVTGERLNPVLHLDARSGEVSVPSRVLAALLDRLDESSITA